MKIDMVVCKWAGKYDNPPEKPPALEKSGPRGCKVWLDIHHKLKPVVTSINSVGVRTPWTGTVKAMNF